MTDCLQIDRQLLIDCLLPAARALKPSEIGRLKLSFNDGKLYIDSTIISINVPAAGDWSSEIYVRGIVFIRAVRAYRKVPEIRLIFNGSRLIIGRKPIKCFTK